MKYSPKSKIAQTCYITHTQKRKKEKENEMMNRKGVEESSEKKEAFMKDNLVKTFHLPYKLFSQSRFSL